jgi:MYXO-CTERM domain-containing protein
MRDNNCSFDMPINYTIHYLPQARVPQERDGPAFCGCGGGQSKPRGIGWFWWLIALLAAILVSFALLSGMLGL